MKISTKGRYGLRAMVDIAANSKGEHVPLNTIAERQDISMNYLEQVFSVLRKAGLVKSVKGAQGGYTLSDTPATITVGSILRALEGDLSVVMDEEENGSENSIQHCLNIKVWKRLNESINDIVDSITLEDMAEEYKRMNGSDNFMFYI
ncbi:MAG: RrF2 family transcriptional regulator [Clostridia bacterium]|nr:RrF2 family transcriptional regulator [Clostridia bacterium]